MVEFTEFLTEKYRAEVAMIQDMLTDFRNVFKSVFPHSTKEPIEIKFIVAKDSDTGEYSLAGNPEAMVFLVAICKMLLDTGELILKSPEYKTHLEQMVQESTRQYITKFIEPISEEAFKRCPMCNYENKYNAEYCSKCGRKL
jgi:hypothetical protein